MSYSIKIPWVYSASQFLGFTFFLMFADIRELFSLEDVMEEVGLGPNGALMYCMEYPFCCYIDIK